MPIKDKWKEFDFTGPNEYVDSVLKELKEKLKPYLPSDSVAPFILWSWSAEPFDVGEEVDIGIPPIIIKLNPFLAEKWEKDKNKVAMILCWTIAHEFYHAYTSITEKDLYDERKADSFATNFSGVVLTDIVKVEHEVLFPTTQELAYWSTLVNRSEKMPKKLKEEYKRLYKKWEGIRKVCLS